MTATPSLYGLSGMLIVFKHYILMDLNLDEPGLSGLKYPNLGGPQLVPLGWTSSAVASKKQNSGLKSIPGMLQLAATGANDLSITKLSPPASYSWHECHDTTAR
jgi:hypothetical protein